MKRRSFLKAAGAVAGGCALGVGTALSADSSAKQGAEVRVAGLPRRTLGRTGRKVSIVGFPGLALANYDQDRGTEGLHNAFERGVNYFDVAPAYGNGDAEIKMGIGLAGIERSEIFLACKTKMRDKAGARQELERSLTRLKTEYFDLYQLHHIRTEDEVEQALGPGGAIETLLEARKEGKVRHLGFSAHTTKGALAALKGFDFDTVMFPINFVEMLKMGFGEQVLELAKRQGAAVLAMKALSMGAWPSGVERMRKWWYRTAESQQEVSLAVRYALSQKCVAAAIPPSFLDLLDKAIEAAKSYEPINKAEVKELQAAAEPCESLFRKEEVARGGAPSGPVYPDSPHECCCAYA